MTTLQNRTALVTGASRGIGRATALAPLLAQFDAAAVRVWAQELIEHGVTVNVLLPGAPVAEAVLSLI